MDFRNLKAPTQDTPPRTRPQELQQARLPNPFPSVPLSRYKENWNLCHPFWLQSSDCVSSSSNLPATTYRAGRKRNNEKAYRPSYNIETKRIKYCF